MTDFVCRCVKYGSNRNLLMYAHRNKNGHMVGWLFSCEMCRHDVEGKYLVSEFKDRDEQ